MPIQQLTLCFHLCHSCSNNKYFTTTYPHPSFAASNVSKYMYMKKLINSRNGNVSDIKDRLGEDNFKIIEVTIPLRRMFGFTTVLRSLTKGRGTFVMTFFNFSPCDLSP